MAKNLKFKIKNTQLAEALQLDKLNKKKQEAVADKKATLAKKKKVVAKKPVTEESKELQVEKTPPPPAPAPESKAPAEQPVETPTEKQPSPKVVDDFRKPKIVRRSAPPTPPKKLPVSRSDKKEGKPKADEKADEKKQTEEKPKVPPKVTTYKDFRDVGHVKKERKPSFDARDRMGLRSGEDERYRKKRHRKQYQAAREDLTQRPKSLHIRLPITVKDLAVDMKLKASQLIQKLFAQNILMTINDLLDDETTVQLLGHEFDCEITIDTAEEKRIQITDKTIKEEIAEEDLNDLQLRSPVITFMGHVDHGKTSLIDAIRKSDIASGEAGAITQHIGAFKCHSDVGEITILDTPGHEAFSAMRERGAEVTDLVVLVIAGDEGMRDQTIEAMKKAKESGVPILVAINKSDKAGFDPDTIYRQLSEHELLPEKWGGATITVNCSATNGEGVKELLEMLALQSEILELKANPKMRARGSVIESQMHKGLGSVATLLVQNGTLKVGDALVFDVYHAKVKTMHDEHGRELQEAGPSTPVKITGLSGLPEAGSEFVVVSSEKEAKDIATVRRQEHRHKQLQKAKFGLEGFLETKTGKEKKVLHVLLRADVQGSLEALKHSLEKIKSDKAELNIVSEEVGQISESDIKLAAASGAAIIGFHTKVESHAESLIKEKKVTIKLHDIIYHAVDDVKEIMRNLLDKIEQENEMGAAEVKAVFKSSHLGRIAGCLVTDGLIKRNHRARLSRNGEIIWKGSIASLKRVKEDVREVSKGVECGILLQGFDDFQEGDEIQAYEITYLEQEL